MSKRIAVMLISNFEEMLEEVNDCVVIILGNEEIEDTFRGLLHFSSFF